MLMINKICQSYINGHYAQHKSNDVLPNLHPANNQIINHMKFADDAVLTHAVENSHHAFKTWSQTSFNQRSNILLKAAAILRENLHKIAEIEVWDTGKPISEALNVDVLSAADSLEYFAKTALAYENAAIPDNNALIYTQREPLGVCAGIGAWNYPLQIACWKAAPALMMGNTMVYKPSEHTPMTSLILAEVFSQAGLPAGVFNVVLGDGKIAEKLLSHHHIAKVSFTGSVATGKKILQQCSSNMLPVTLELGGKSPLIIFKDADIDQAVIASMLANFYTQGEICSNGTRVFVARSVHDVFLEKLLARVKKLIIGDPFQPATQIGALISKTHQEKVLNYIQQGKQQGAELLHGGNAVAKLQNGNFVEPTIFTQCHDDMIIVRDEIFGPVMSILIFDDEDEVIQRANRTHFGLAAGIFTQDIKRAHRIAKQIQAGVCWINNYNVTPVGMPFGGYKHSGLGRENGLIALSHYSQVKSIYVELNEIVHSYL